MTDNDEVMRLIEEVLGPVTHIPPLIGEARFSAQHHEDKLCEGMHCRSHHVDEKEEADSYRKCRECGHVFQTPEALREAWVEEGQGYGGYTALAQGEVTKRLAEVDIQPPSAEEIYFCPCCDTDF